MFIGEYRHSLDSKSRLSVPVKLREELGEEFVMCRGFDKCVMIFPLDAWTEFAQKLEAFSVMEGRNFTRYFFSGAMRVTMDTQGRALVPQVYRDFAGLDKDVVLIGNNKRLELWDEETWNNELATNLNSDDIAGGLMNLGF